MKIINYSKVRGNCSLGYIYETKGFEVFTRDDGIAFGILGGREEVVEYKDLKGFSLDRKTAKKQAKYLVKIILDRLYKEDKYDFNDLFRDSEQAVKDYNNNKANGIK